MKTENLMQLKIIRQENKLCLSCNKIHDVLIVSRKEIVEVNGVKVTFPAIYEYCEEYDELTETEDLMDQNYKTMMGELEKTSLSAVVVRREKKND